MGDLSASRRIGALHRSATENTTAMTAAARSAYRASFDTGGQDCSVCGTHPVIPPELPAAERERRSAASYRAHLARVSQRAVEAKRRAAAGAQMVAEAADALAELAGSEPV